MAEPKISVTTFLSVDLANQLQEEAYRRRISAHALRILAMRQIVAESESKPKPATTAATG